MREQIATDKRTRSGILRLHDAARMSALAAALLIGTGCSADERAGVAPDGGPCCELVDELSGACEFPASATPLPVCETDAGADR